MKITQYETYRDGSTVTVVAGPVVDFDLQGGLEELLWKEVAGGVDRIRLVLGGMRFLHAGLTSCILALQRHLQPLGGEVVLVDAPDFAQLMLRQWGVDKRFLFANSREEGPFYLAHSAEAFAAVAKLKHELIQGGIDPNDFLG